jgi:hypothetical protein
LEKIDCGFQAMVLHDSDFGFVDLSVSLGRINLFSLKWPIDLAIKNAPQKLLCGIHVLIPVIFSSAVF